MDRKPTAFRGVLRPSSPASPRSAPRLTFRWPHTGRHVRPRFSSCRGTRTRIIVVIFMVLCSLIIISTFLPDIARGDPERPRRSAKYVENTTVFPQVAFQPPESMSYRMPDTIDTFASYKHRDGCNISSLDLHAPFGPLCHNRDSMVAAMSSGGRIGSDAPYMPRGCDMRWFSSEEVCEILERFDKVVIVGDSMLRHVMGSINILLRKDIGYGAVTDWNFSQDERQDCFCNEQFDVKTCSVQGIYKTADVMAKDPTSLSCTKPINVLMEQIVRYPIPAEELHRLRSNILRTTSSRPIAFIFGHGLWSDLNLQNTMKWLDTIIEAIFHTVGSNWSGLFVTPNASGKQKPDEWIVSQGNKALILFEEAVGLEVAKRGVEHLGTWNMSIQATKYDGVHLDMKGNLVKAMMVMNWLNLIDH